MSEERKDIKADFEDFVSEKDPVPRRISEQILAAIHRQIYPSRTQLFLKVFTIHLLVSCFSLSVCSQFGVRAFEIYDLMTVFMQFVGHTARAGFGWDRLWRFAGPMVQLLVPAFEGPRKLF